MENRKYIKRRPIGRRVSMAVILLTLFSTLSICFFSYYIYRKDAMVEHTNRSKDIAISVSAAIEPDRFEASVHQETEDDYWHVVKAYLDTVKTDTDLEYLYIITPYDAAANIYRYYCEGIKPSDDPENIGEFGYVETDPTVFDAEALITYSTGECTITMPYYSEAFGYLVTGFAPIIGTDGKPVAVVGADINVSRPAQAANTFALYVIVASVVFSLIFAFISKFYIQHLVRRALYRVTDGTHLLSEGDLTFQARAADSNDDIGKLYANFAKVVANFKMLIDDLNYMSAMHADGEYEARLDESKYTGAYLDVVKGINNMTFLYVNNFNELLEVIKLYGNGNFEANVSQYPGRLAEGNKIVDDLRGHLVKVSNEINHLAETALSGNLSVRASTENLQGDWAKIVVNLNGLMDAFVLPIQEASHVLQEMSDGNMHVQMTGTYKGDFSLLSDNFNKTVNELASYIWEINESLEAIAANDLTVGINKRFVGDFASIEEAIHSIMTNQSMFFNKVSEIAGFLNNQSMQLANSSRHMSDIVDEQNSTIGHLTTSIATVNTQAHDNAKNAGDADTVSEMSMQNAESGNNEMQGMLQSMEEIIEASKRIANIIKTIDGIASQTNLLALNAAVEAARAGEHGQGFAVVAEEVRNLAARSLQAAKESQKLIDDTLSKINIGVNRARSTSDTLAMIVDNITSCSDLVSKISVSSKEQADAVTLVNDGINKILSTIQNSAAMAEENTGTSNELSRQSASLHQLLSSVKLTNKASNTHSQPRSGITT